MNYPLVYIGTSGWYYDHWEGILYPEGLPKGKRYEIYAKEFNTVEINATFYRFPSESIIDGWYKKAPEGFIYAIKANRFITHINRLKNSSETLDRFLNMIMNLKNKLGVILFQLPPSMKLDTALLKEFLTLLPDSLKCCFEFRHASWECDNIYGILDQSGVGHVVVSKKGYPYVQEHTGGIVYYRLHGPDKLYASSYPDDWLETLADQLIGLLKNETPFYVYFNNDFGGHAVFNARTLKALLEDRIKIL